MFGAWEVPTCNYAHLLFWTYVWHRCDLWFHYDFKMKNKNEGFGLLGIASLLWLPPPCLTTSTMSLYSIVPLPSMVLFVRFSSHCLQSVYLFSFSPSLFKTVIWFLFFYELVGEGCWGGRGEEQKGKEGIGSKSVIFFPFKWQVDKTPINTAAFAAMWCP